MNSFLISLAGSLVAAIVIALFGYFFSRTFRDLLVMIFSRLLGIGIDKIYKKSTDSNDDVSRAVEQAEFVKIFAPRGHTLSGEYVTRLSKKPKSVCHILLPSTNNDALYWIEQRASERTAPHKKEASDLINAINTTADSLSTYEKQGLLKLKRFNHPHIARLVITDKWVFFLPLKSGVRAMDCKMVKYSRCSFMYDFWNRYFDQIWDSIPD